MATAVEVRSYSRTSGQTSLDSVTHILGTATADFGANGTWPVNGAFAGLGQASGFMTFTFATGMNFAGALVNFDFLSDTSIFVSALDAIGDVILTQEIQFDNVLNPPGFYGFSKVSVKGRGPNLLLPARPLSPAVTVQLVRTDDPSICWKATFNGGITRQDATTFRAKSD